MSFLSQAWMLDKYGPRLAMKDLADVLGRQIKDLRTLNHCTARIERCTRIQTRQKRTEPSKHAYDFAGWQGQSVTSQSGEPTALEDRQLSRN
jgi:hypothetical protein